MLFIQKEVTRGVPEKDLVNTRGGDQQTRGAWGGQGAGEEVTGGSVQVPPCFQNETDECDRAARFAGTIAGNSPPLKEDRNPRAEEFSVFPAGLIQTNPQCPEAAELPIRHLRETLQRLGTTDRGPEPGGWCPPRARSRCQPPAPPHRRRCLSSWRTKSNTLLQ